MTRIQRFRLLDENTARAKLRAARGSGGEASPPPASPPEFGHGAPWAQGWIADEIRGEAFTSPQEHVNAARMRDDAVEEWIEWLEYLAPRLLWVVLIVGLVLIARHYLAGGSVIVEQIERGIFHD